MPCDQYSLSWYRTPGNLAWNCAFIHSHSTNVSRIANLEPRCDRAPKTAQSTYCSCYNPIGTIILNWSQSSKNHTVGFTVRFKPRQKPTVLCPVRVTTLQHNGGSGFWTGLEPNRKDYPVQTRTAAWLPGHVANTTSWPLPGSLWIHRLKYQRTGGKLIQLSMITTPTQWRLAVHFRCRT